MNRILTLFAAILLVVLCGVIHGVWTDRWQVSQDVHHSSAALERVPENFGDWEGQLFELPANQLQVAEIAGYFGCRYIHRQNGNVVSVLLVCGRPGPIAVHPPDVCYQGQGFGLVGPPEKQTINMNTLVGTTDTPEFLMAKFRKAGASVPETIRVFWSWSATGSWQVPSNTRIAFARHSALYKLYIVRDLTLPDEPIADDPVVEFLREFLPQLNQTLFTEKQ